MKIKLLLIFLSIGIICSAQKRKNDTCESLMPLNDSAFNRMIIQDITFAIVGEQTPVSGVKIDITKPEGTISGVFASKKKPWLIFGFDLKGGVTDKNFSILKGYDNFNTAFEVKPSIHIIPSRSSAKFGICEVAVPNTQIVDAKNQLVKRQQKSVIDTFYVITRLYNQHFGSVIKSEALPIEVTQVDTIHKKIAVFFLRKLLKNESLQISGQTEMSTILNIDMDTILKTMPIVQKSGNIINANTYIDESRELYKKYAKHYKNLETETLDKFISNASEIWTQKHYEWWSFSPFLRTEKVNEYYTKYEGKDSLYFKSDYRENYGLSVYYNWYLLGIQKKIAQLIRFGGGISKNNNLTALSSYTYETRIPFFVDGTNITQKTKSGTAYNHNDIKTGFLSQLNFEYYLLPLSSLVPGVYVSSSLKYSKLYNLPTIVDRENDKTQVPLEGGLVFNITNREKDKTFISILLYARHEDITDKRRTSVQTGLEESTDDFRKRNVGFGFRVGIPITLPQTTK